MEYKYMVPNYDAAPESNETDEELSLDRTVMEQWAQASKEYSEAVSKLCGEFGWCNELRAKELIHEAFPRYYLKNFNKIANNRYENTLGYVNAVEVAKAIFLTSALLQTTNLEEIIKWANDTI